MTAQVYEDVQEMLKALKLSTLRQELDECLRLAEAKSLSHLEFLRALFKAEMKGRKASSIRKRLSAAHFPVLKRIDEFDFTFQKSVKKARIINLADAYDAMVSKRCYKAAYDFKMAREEILKESGKHFDPMVVKTFLDLEETFIQLRKEYS